MATVATITLSEEQLNEAFNNALNNIVAETGCTLKECVEKQEAKAVKLYIGDDMSCPACGKRLRGYEGVRNPYCKFCGQKLER